MCIISFFGVSGNGGKPGWLALSYGKTIKSSCGKPQDAYRPWHNLSKHNLSGEGVPHPVLASRWYPVQFWLVGWATTSSPGQKGVPGREGTWDQSLGYCPPPKKDHGPSCSTTDGRRDRDWVPTPFRQTDWRLWKHYLPVVLRTRAVIKLSWPSKVKERKACLE